MITTRQAQFITQRAGRQLAQALNQATRQVQQEAQTLAQTGWWHPGRRQQATQIVQA